MTKRNDIDTLRNLSGDIWNVAVDEHQAGFLKRRDLLKYAALLGLTGFAASHGLFTPRAARAAGAGGGTVRVGLGQPTKAIDPVTVTDPASIGVLSQVGEYLILDDPKDGLQPKLALSWEADETAKRWTFKLRPGVKVKRSYSSSFFFSAVPRMSPSVAPESADPYCAMASFSSAISSALIDTCTLWARRSNSVTRASTFWPTA